MQALALMTTLFDLVVLVTLATCFSVATMLDASVVYVGLVHDPPRVFAQSLVITFCQVA
jgi:hypothetical protein